jgi:hypothetical protein
MAGATGLEPAASCVTGRPSNQLNYVPKCPILFKLQAMQNVLQFEFPSILSF